MSTVLRQAFEEAAKVYNEANYDKLGAFLDNDVVMKRVDDAGSVVGIGNVIAYLNTHQKPLKPQFINPQNVSVKEKGNLGIVTGSAEHVDNQQTRKTIPIDFTFVFTRDDPKSDWLLINVFAVPK